LAGARTLGLLLAVGAAPSGCFVEHSSYNPPIDRTASIPKCPTDSDPAAGVTIDTDVGAKLTMNSGEGVSVEYSSGGLWHLQTTCSSGYQCGFDVTAEVFEGSVSNVMGEDLESNDVVGSVCPDTAYMMMSTAGDFDGMIFTATPGAKIRVTAALDHTIFANLIQWSQNGNITVGNANPLDLTPVSP
jgi:hypothetical protein